jgi:hypothetical protein
MASAEDVVHCEASRYRLDSRTDVLTIWHLLLANFFFAEGGAYNLGCDKNVTCHGLVLSIILRSASDPAFDGSRTFKSHQTLYDREWKMRFRYCDPQRSY